MFFSGLEHMRSIKVVSANVDNAFLNTMTFAKKGTELVVHLKKCPLYIFKNI